MSVRIILVFFTMQLVIFAAASGKGSIKGKIIDNETKKPLIGVTVILNSTQSGSHLRYRRGV